MREAIERVIADLGRKKKTCNPDADMFDSGLSNAYEYAINQLKAVLAEHENTNPRQTRTGGKDDTAE